MGNKYLYHGTTKSAADDIIKNGINLNKSRKYLDFGKGFYLTENKGTAWDWVITAGLAKDDIPAVLKFSANFDGLNKYSHKVDDKWRLDIWKYRVLGDNTDDFDLIIGPIADSGVNDYSVAARKGHVTKEEFLKHTAPKKASKQYVFKTPLGISALRLEEKE